MNEIGNISCGIAGWSYPDWDGYVYPPGTKDKLRFIAGYVDVIEINSTFYRPPDPRTAESWADRTADLPDFFFTAKLNRDITHRGIIDPQMTDTIHRGFEPLVKENKLKHLLAQFRYDYANTPETRAHLKKIRDNFGNITNLTLELRHNSWQSPSALEFLRELNVSVANLDYPTTRNSFNLHLCDVGKHAYFRLHGRNAAAWFNKQAGRDETYNYLYSGKEVDQIADRGMQLAGISKTLTLIANNHFQGKEAVNILQIKSRITGNKVPVPPGLAAKYPALTRIATAP